MTPQELYDWISKQEAGFVDTAVPFSDRQIKFLISKLKLVQPLLISSEPDNTAWTDFAGKMEYKFLKCADDQKYMLVDFCKHVIHTKLIMGTGRL